MPAPMSFAFPDALAATGMAAAGTGAGGTASATATATGEGAGIFGQLIDAASPQQGQAADAAPLPVDGALASLTLAAGAQAAASAKGQQPMLSADPSALPLAAAPEGENPLAVQPVMGEPSDTLQSSPAPTAPMPQIAMLADSMATQPAADAAPEALLPTADNAASVEEGSAEGGDPSAQPSDPAEPVVLAAAALETPRPHLPPAALAMPSTAQPSSAAAEADAAGEALGEGEGLKALNSAPISRAADIRMAASAPQGDSAMNDNGSGSPQPQMQSTAAVLASASAEPMESALPAALLTQALASGPTGASAAPANPYAATVPTAVPSPVVQAKSGQMGADIGAEIAKVLQGEGDSLLIRLDPRELGRVDVRLSFDKDGILRAVMQADSPMALEMLRRESGELNRALADAGVRSDGQSLRFDARSGDGSGQGAQPWRDARSGAGRMGAEGDAVNDEDLGRYRPLRTTTQVDLIA